jgi:hypothetical protein
MQKILLLHKQGPNHNPTKCKDYNNNKESNNCGGGGNCNGNGGGCKNGNSRNDGNNEGNGNGNGGGNGNGNDNGGKNRNGHGRGNWGRNGNGNSSEDPANVSLHEEVDTLRGIAVAKLTGSFAKKQKTSGNCNHSALTCQSTVVHWKKDGDDDSQGSSSLSTVLLSPGNHQLMPKSK